MCAQVLMDPVCMLTIYPQLLQNFVYKSPRMAANVLGLVDSLRFLFSRDLLVAEVGSASLLVWPIIQLQPCTWSAAQIVYTGCAVLCSHSAESLCGIGSACGLRSCRSPACWCWQLRMTWCPPSCCASCCRLSTTPARWACLPPVTFYSFSAAVVSAWALSGHPSRYVLRASVDAPLTMLCFNRYQPCSWASVTTWGKCHVRVYFCERSLHGSRTAALLRF